MAASNLTFGSISILGHTPVKNGLNVPYNSNITVQFNSAIDVASLTNLNIRVNGMQSGLHPCAFTYNTGNNTVTINPNVDFKLSEIVEVVITRRVKSITNDSLAMPYVWRFTVIVLQGVLSYVKDTTFSINNPIGGILADVDNDGDLDEIISSHDVGTITIYKNNGNGKFSYSSTLSGGGLAGTTYPPACGDFNADGYIDVAAPVRFSNLVSVWFNNGDGTFSPAQQPGTDEEPDRINVSDYNGDGYLDMAVRCHSSGSYYMDIFLNDRTGHYVRTQQYHLPSRLHCQSSGDFDGDGDIDIVVATHDANLHVLFNNGNGVFSESVPTIPNIYDYLVTGDIDADGDLDIITDNPNGLAILKNNGSGIFTITQETGSSSYSYLFKILKDFDADGDLDLIMPNMTLNREEFYINDGTGHFTYGFSIQGWSSNNAYEIDAGDLNGNGNLDLAGPHSSSFVVYLATLPVPSAPVLVLPANNTTGVVLIPLMDWNDVSGAISYRIQIAIDSGFTSITYDTSGLTTSQVNVPSGKLNSNTLYYWRVNATNAVGTGSWSNIWRFTTMGLPGVPVLVSPVNNSTNIALTPTLTWNSVPTATNYRLQIAVDSNFTNVIVSDSTLTVGSYTVQSGVLAFNSSYYWRVKAKNPIGSGNWSAAWKFSTLELPVAPVLVSPANNSNNISLTPTMLWNNVPTAINYRLQISVDSNFASFVLQDSTLTQNYKIIQSGLLTNNTKYFWRVCAKNTNGWGMYCSKWNFRTEILSLVLNYREGIPEKYKLHNNYPNPFNPVTKIKFDIPKSSNVKILIYDVSGREVMKLIDINLNAGYYEVQWNAGEYASGIYFYRLETENYSDVRKMVLIK